MQSTRAGHRALEPQRDRKMLRERIDLQPVERQEEVRQLTAHPGADIRVGAIEAGEDRLRFQRLRDHPTPVR